MTSSMRGWWALAVLVVLAGLVSPRRSEACGAFAGRRGPTDAELHERTPYLAVEQALIVWDQDTFTEDFIREARFAKTGEAFGFVVPTPGLPSVSKVDESPFTALRKEYPFTGRLTGDDVKGGGSGGAAPPRLDTPAVEVFSQQRVGSFDVTVLLTLEFPPPAKPGPGRFRLTVKQSLFVPSL